MKNKILIPLLLVFLMGSSLSGYSQKVIAQRQAVSEKSIPKIVSSTFHKQYPDILLKGWYSTHLVYWQNDYSSNWYQSWYGERSIVIYTYQNPNYFEVEFIDSPGELSRAIYNYYGYWYETRTQINGLPMSIHKALEESKYNSWKISSLKEKLESPAWPVEVYRFHVSKGAKSQIIRMDAEGNFIQIKELAQ